MSFCFAHTFVFDCVSQFSLHQHSVLVALTCAKLALRIVIIAFHRKLSLLLRLNVIAYIHSVL